MSYKRLWWKIIRVRGHLKPIAALTGTLLISTLIFDSVFIVRHHGQDPKQQTRDDHITSTSLPLHSPHSPKHISPPTSPSAFPTSSTSSSSPGQQTQLDAGKLSKNTYFEEYKGRVVYGSGVGQDRQRSERRWEGKGSRETDTQYDRNWKGSRETENDREMNGSRKTETQNDKEWKGSRETENDREGKGSREIETESDRERKGSREIETENDRERNGSRETENGREIETENDRERDGSRETENDREMNESRETERHNDWEKKEIEGEHEGMGQMLSGENNKLLGRPGLNRGVPSFGFINSEFQPPSLSQSAQPNGLLDMLKGLTNGGLNPGSILGAVAALNEVRASSQGEGNPVKTMMKIAEVVGKVMAPSNGIQDTEKNKDESKNLPTSQSFLNSEYRVSENGKNSEGRRVLGYSKNISGGERPDAPTNSKQMLDRRQEKGMAESTIGQGSNKGQRSLGGALGTLTSVLGPSLLAGMMGSNGEQSKSGTKYPPLLQSLVGNIGSSVLASLASQGPSTKGDQYSKKALNSMSLGSLISEVGPGLLNGVLQNGLGQQGSQSQSHGGSNLVQSMLGGMGASLIQSLNQGQGHGKSQPESSPVQSLVSGLGASLLQSLSQGNGGRSQSNSSPVQSLVSGLAPVLMAGVLNQAGNSNSAGEIKQSPLQLLVQNVGPAMLKGLLGGGAGGSEGGRELRGGVGRETGGERNIKTHEKVMVGGGENKEIKRNNIVEGERGEEKREGIHGGGKGSLRMNAGIVSENVAEGRLIGTGKMNRDRWREKKIEDGEMDEPSKTKTQFQREVRMNMTRGSRTLQAKESEMEAEKILDGIEENHSYINYNENDNNKLNKESGRRGPNPKTVRLVTRALLSSLVPEELPVPETNTTKGLWEMAVNILFGNPRQELGRRSQFWKWLREYGGGEIDNEEEKYNEQKNEEEENSEQREIYDGENLRRDGIKESGIKMDFKSYMKVAFKNAASSVYEMLERGGQNQLCLNSLSVGGVYRWKKGYMEGNETICADVDTLPKNSDCLVYSFGLSPSWTFEEGMEKLGCQVYSFDPRPWTGNHNHSTGIHFYNLGLGHLNTTRNVQGQVWNLFTLSAIMDRLGHSTSPLHYLRIADGEGREWQILQEATTNSPQHITNIIQLGVRVNLHSALRDPSLYQNYLNLLLELEALGFQLFSSTPVPGREWARFDETLGRRVNVGYDLVFLRI